MPRKCIFFLTFARRELIYESRCEFQIADFEQGESLDEERNQEGSREEGSGKESARKESSGKESSGQESSCKESSCKESRSQESAREESCREEVVKSGGSYGPRLFLERPWQQGLFLLLRAFRAAPDETLNKGSMPPPDTAYLLADQALMAHARNYFAWQSRLVLREAGRRVVEAGCGAGNFTTFLLDRELAVAVDEEPACIERLGTRLGERANVATLVAGICSAEFRSLRRFRPDTCICLNVLEHIEDDLEALRSMASILSPRGRIVLIVPAFAGLYGPIDKRLGHCRRYTKKAMRLLAQAAGLRVRVMHYMNCAGFFGWWFNARVLQRDRQSAAQIRFFDRYVVPVVSTLEALLPPPFGQSLFVVLEPESVS